MVYQEITSKLIEEIYSDLEFFDENGFLPIEKKRIDITLSGIAISKLKGKNKSKVINDLIINYLNDQEVKNEKMDKSRS